MRAGRFFVYGAHDAGQVPHGVVPIRIEAGLAFGTGHHETTALCLEVLSDLARDLSDIPTAARRPPTAIEVEEIQSREQALWHILDTSDYYDPERVNFDKELLRRFYLQNGYVDFKLTNVSAALASDRSSFFLTYTIV